MSEFADGGSSKRCYTSPLPTKNECNIAAVVRSEINNVLLGQQVALLSQILLGQNMDENNANAMQTPTLTNVFGIPRFNNLEFASGNARTKPIQPKTKEDVEMSCDKEKENKIPLEETIEFQNKSQFLQQSPVQPKTEQKNIRCTIPLFHVPEITKLQEPQIKLIETPNTLQAWAASSIDRKNTVSRRILFSPVKLNAHIEEPTAFMSPQTSEAFKIVSQKRSRRNSIKCLSTTIMSQPNHSHHLTSQHLGPPLYPTVPLLNPVEPIITPKPFFQVSQHSANKDRECLFGHVQSSTTVLQPFLQHRPHIGSTFINPQEVILYRGGKKRFISVKVNIDSIILILSLHCFNIASCNRLQVHLT